MSVITDFMCLTALDPTLSATNSTVRRNDGGWLWKKACSSSPCQGVQFKQAGWTRSTFAGLNAHLQLLLRPVGDGRVFELSGGGRDFADDSAAFRRAAGHKGGEELAKLTWMKWNVKKKKKQQTRSKRQTKYKYSLRNGQQKYRSCWSTRGMQS